MNAARRLAHFFSNEIHVSENTGVCVLCGTIAVYQSRNYFHLSALSPLGCVGSMLTFERELCVHGVHVSFCCVSAFWRINVLIKLTMEIVHSRSVVWTLEVAMWFKSSMLQWLPVYNIAARMRTMFIFYNRLTMSCWLNSCSL